MSRKCALRFWAFIWYCTFLDEERNAYLWERCRLGQISSGGAWEGSVDTVSGELRVFASPGGSVITEGPRVRVVNS